MIYKIAGLKVEMNPKYDMTINRCRKYAAPEETAFDFKINPPDKVLKEYSESTPELTEEECEYMLYCSGFYYNLVSYGGIMLHSSAVVYNDRAYLFSANSGTGKSTHTSIWLKVFPGSYIINDDKPAVIVKNGKAYCCGTPFSGKHDISENKEIEIAAIAYIERSSSNHIERISSKEALWKFLPQTLRSFDKFKGEQFLNVLSDVIKTVPFYNLKCNMEDDAAIVAYKEMSKNS